MALHEITLLTEQSAVALARGLSPAEAEQALQSERACANRQAVIRAIKQQIKSEVKND
jgi:hypothetical protein